MPATIQPFQPAVQRLAGKVPVASALGSREWQEMALALKERAFFSSRVESLRVLVAMQSKLDEAVSLSSRQQGKPGMDRSRFVAQMRQVLGANDGDSGMLTDLTSTRRLGMIWDVQLQDAYEYGRWKMGQDEDILEAYPCQELVRIEPREEERDWLQIWIDHGGLFYKERSRRMIARKDDPIWTAISRFGRPWPPFDFGSGMGLQELERSEAEAIGAIAPGQKVAPQDLSFNHRLEASVPDATPALLEGFKGIFGDQVDVDRAGKIAWQGDRIRKLYEAALADPSVKWSIDLGAASPGAILSAKAVGVDLTGARLQIDADHIRHAAKRHGANESLASQQPLRAYDFALLPVVWREPDSVMPGSSKGTLVFGKELYGELVAPVWHVKSSGFIRLLSLWKRRAGVSAVPRGFEPLGRTP